MDGGFRAPRPTDRRVVTRMEPAHQQPAPNQVPTPAAPTPANRPSVSHQGTRGKSSKRFVWPIIIVIIIILAAAGWFAWSKLHTEAGIESNRYQAVFFTNGQVYFGKLHTMDSEHMRLTDIFYLQTQANGDSSDSTNPQKTSTDQNNVQLIKLGDEIHGPEDAMILSKDQLLFYENLKTDSKVVQSIEKYKSAN